MNHFTAKKILHIVEDLKIGGLEKVLASIVESLDKTKYYVHVWCLASGGDIAQTLIEKGISLRILSMTSYYNPLSIARLSLHMERESFDIIHTHGYFASTFGRLGAILAHIPIIINHVHSTYYDYSKRNLLIEKYLSYFTDRTVCVSNAVENFVTEIEGINKDKTSLIYNGVDFPDHIYTADDRKLARNALEIDANSIVIIVVASLTANKGHGLLLYAFQKVYQTHPSIRLVIVGDGPLRLQIENEVRLLKIDKAVIFTGIQNDIYRMLQIADIFVLPSQIREGFGLAVIEAMATGLPVIGTDVGGIPELIRDGENGLLVPSGNLEKLADAIKKLSDDQRLRSSMGKQGRQIYEKKFTLAKMIQQIERLYDELLLRKIYGIRS